MDHGSVSCLQLVSYSVNISDDGLLIRRIQLSPDAFYVSVSQSGNNQYAGVLTDWFINKEHSWFVVETTGQPTIATVTNQSAFNQYFEVYVLFIRVITKADFLLIMEALDRIGTSKASEVALLQSATLLRQMQYSVTSGR